MRIETSQPKLIDDGDYSVIVTKGYGDPHGDICLDGGKWEITITQVRPEDCDRLIKAAAEIKQKVLAYREQLAAPHGTAHVYKGRCQLCGKPEDDELHAEPEPELYAAAIQQAEYFAQPGNTVADLLAEQAAS